MKPTAQSNSVIKARLRALVCAPIRSTAWRGAFWGGLSVFVLLVLTAAYGLFGHAPAGRFVIGAVLLLALFALLGAALTLVGRLLRALPPAYFWVLACTLLVLTLMALVAMSVSVGIFAAGLGMTLAASLLGAGVYRLASERGSASRVRRAAPWMALLAGLAGLAAGGIWLLGDGTPPPMPPNAAALSGARVQALALPDPSQPGPYSVRSLVYGSGTDLRRPEYGGEVDIITQPVDGSALVEKWSGLRSRYWGFGPQALPLNARVWYPQGDGPFPLVLIVHGQHPMEDFSDGGYAYLGELLASQGYITASVDENFLNLSPLTDALIVQSLAEEDDLRGWLLLEHLNLWRSWNSQPGSVFYHKVDLENIALAGHSRGGEAVAAAAVFNRLSCAPNDAHLRFDYHFNIRGLIAIAPIDGAYHPAGQDIFLDDVSYLVLQGAHDMDVFSFQGNRQYERVRFGDASDAFKAAVYFYGANHGQFNTVWGRKDLFEPVMRVFNLAQLMPGDAQRQIAGVTISAFLDASLRGARGYRALFQDLRTGNDWLPDTIYLSQYQDAHTRMAAAFEEDADPGTATLPGGTLYGAHLSVWREQPLPAKWETLGSQVVALGWDTAASPQTASYTLRLPEGWLPVTRDSTLVFSMADAGEDPTPDEPEDAPVARSPIDLTIEAVDRAGNTARLPLSHFSLLQPQLEGRLGKAAFFSPFPTSEAVPQHFEFPLQDFADANPNFEPQQLAQVRFVFDRTPAAVIFLDAIGLRSGD